MAELPRLSDMDRIAVMTAAAILDALVEIAEYARERGEKIVLEPQEGGGWTATLGPVSRDTPLTFAHASDLPHALDLLTQLLREEA
jgi:hypothetical protein